MSLFLHGFLCSSSHFPEWLNVSQHMGLMVATQPCDLCNSYLVWAGERVELLLLHQGLLWTEPWGFDKPHQSPSSPPKDKKPFSAGVQIAAGLQCGCPTPVAKGGEVNPAHQALSGHMTFHSKQVSAHVKYSPSLLDCVCFWRLKSGDLFPSWERDAPNLDIVKCCLKNSPVWELSCRDSQLSVSVAISQTPQLQHWP